MQPIGTPAFAVVAGTITTATAAGIYPSDPNRCGTTVVLAGIDGATYTYCHLSQLAVRPGQTVTEGTIIGFTGGAPGSAGAGNTTGPHLHLGIAVGGVSVCPQPLLLAIYHHLPISPGLLPPNSCISDGPRTDWVSWLRVIAQEEPSR